MSYTKKTWSTGDTITADALNNLESGASANAAAIAEIEKELPTYVGADVPRKAAETITPGTENQTIAANQYLTGAQTIKGDGNLSAGNIKKGTSIFGVTGTLETGNTGTDTSDATATAGDILYGETAYVRGEKVTGTIKSVSAATITPGTENQTIASGQYLAGAQTIKGDSSLIPENIKKGISIFGVGGTAEMDTSDATAEAGDILKGKTAYIASGKVTGTLGTSSRLLYDSGDSGSGDASLTETKTTPAVGSTYKKIYVKAPSVTSTRGKTVVDASNVEIGVEVGCSDFGNAVAANVLSGKTFTASPGLKVNGTMASKEAETITPGVDDQTIAANQYLAGAQTIKGDSNLVAENIKSGVSIFGVTGTLETGSTETDKTGTGAYIWEKRDEKIWWVESRGSSTSSKPSGYSTTAYSSRTITDDGYYSLSNSGIGLDSYYLPTGATNGKTKTILYKPYSAYGSSYYVCTLSDEKGKTGKKGDTILGYISADSESAYPNSGVQGDVFYTLIKTPAVNVTANQMLDGIIACGQSGKVKGTIKKKSSATITPSTADQTISSGQYLSGPQTIKGDENLVAENIKSGVAIFGVTGTLETGTDTSDATATSADILSGKTAYVNGAKVTGTIASKAAETITPGTVDQTIASGQYLSGAQTIKGDANLIADNIKKGVSIFGVSGTLESGGTGGASTNNCEAYLITSTTQAVNFKNTGGTLKVWGYGTQTGASSWGGSTTKLLSFDGDKYYVSANYGSPTENSLNLSINANGTISGLPTLASCSLLVTMGV